MSEKRDRFNPFNILYLIPMSNIAAFFKVVRHELRIVRQDWQGEHHIMNCEVRRPMAERTPP